MINKNKKVCVFCGSNFGKNKNFISAAKELGKEIVKNNMDLVYGGGNVGLMSILSSSVLDNGGKVYGVIPKFMDTLELSRQDLTELIITQTMHERKRKMYDLADFFVVLPGGIGTLDETAEVLTWLQLSIHHKPCALINVDGFFDDLINFFKKCVSENFIKSNHYNMLIIEQNPNMALQKCMAFAYPNENK